MIEYHNSRPTRIIGPQGRSITRDDLPAPDTTRWVASRKAQVVAAVESGLLTVEQVMARYNLSFEEFASWQRAMDRAGVAGLRVTWTQHDRADRRRLHSAHEAPPRRLMLV